MNAPLPFAPAPYVDRPLGRDWHARAGAVLLRLLGWRLRLVPEVPARCVIVVYPHTSNWDFVIGLAAKWYFALEFSFMAKDTLFVWPFAGLLARWGAVPIDRRAPHGMIGASVERFAQAGDFRMLITPEGTRSRRDHWHSGFYHLAREAGVPIVLGYIDYGRREAGIGACLVLTGDADADMARIAAFYADTRGKRPEKASPVRLAPGRG